MEQEEVMVSSPVSVVDNGRKLRLIFDLRYVNGHWAKHSFHLDDLRTLVELCRKGDYIWSEIRSRVVTKRVK